MPEGPNTLRCGAAGCVRPLPERLSIALRLVRAGAWQPANQLFTSPAVSPALNSRCHNRNSYKTGSTDPTALARIVAKAGNTWGLLGIHAVVPAWVTVALGPGALPILRQLAKLWPDHCAAELAYLGG